MFKNRIFIVFLHLLAWSFFLLFPLFAFPRLSTLIEYEESYKIVYLVSSLTTICFYYLDYYVIIPTLLFKQKYVLFTVLCISLIVISVVLTRAILSIDFGTSHSTNTSPPRLVGNYLLRFFIVFMVAFGFRFYQKMKRIEAERISSELAHLKAQINPHFLFNTLNGIYGLALTKSDKTAEYLSKLSSMMRYSLSETSAEKVPLEDEINYLQNYIALQKIRLTETTQVNFTVKGPIDSKEIPPLLFINFIENAFKFGVSNEVETEIRIEISVEENTISMYAKNDKVLQNSAASSHEMGLKNIKRRLDLIFENKYKLEIENTEKTFAVHLTIHQL